MTVARRLRRTVGTLATFSLVAAGLALAPVAASAAGTASISGTVTASDGGAALADVGVWLYAPSGATVIGSDTTDASGAYTIPDLDAGTYKLAFIPPAASDYGTEFYPAGYSYATASTFDLADGQALTADIALTLEATFSGTVIGADGPSDNWRVILRRYEGGVYSGYFGGATISSTGEWTDTVPFGDYLVHYLDDRDDALPTTYRDVYHDQVLTSEAATTITVAPGESVVMPTVTMSRLGPVANERLFGPTRYETAVEIAKEFDSFAGAAGTYVYIAAGANYPDALSAGPAAAHRNAPLLLTQRTSLPTVVRDEIVRLAPETVIIAGGTGVVSSAVETEIATLVDTVVRLGGADRYETSALIVSDAFPTAGSAFIATGRNYPDALAATASAAKLGGPVVLVNGVASSVDTDTSALLTALGVTDVYIAGGSAVVSSGIETALASVGAVSSVVRLGGADRYDTSLLINTEIFQTQDVGDDTDVYLAVGTGFADALAGAALAGRDNAPLFTVPSSCVPADVLELLAIVKVEKVWLLGGTGVLTDAVRDLTPCG